jgi:hypothetical protein
LKSISQIVWGGGGGRSCAEKRGVLCCWFTPFVSVSCTETNPSYDCLCPPETRLEGEQERYTARLAPCLSCVRHVRSCARLTVPITHVDVKLPAQRNFCAVTVLRCLGGVVVVSVLATGPKGCGFEPASPDAFSSSFFLFITESCRNVSNNSAIFASLSICHLACKNSRIAGRNCTGFDIAKFSLNVSFVKTGQKRKLNTYPYSFMSLSLALSDICVSKR